MNKCLKQHVEATILTIDNFRIIGTNGINNNEITECPREIDGYLSGEGYHLCKDICNQNGHAEIEALNLAKKWKLNLKNSLLFLTGHTYCCDNCLNAMKESGIKKVYILNDKKNIINFYEI